MNLLRNFFNRRPKPGQPRKIHDPDFENQVIQSDQPVVVDFFSNRCQPCQVMSGLLNEIGPEYANRIKIVKINVDYDTESAMKYQVRSVPTLLFFKNGRLRETVTGLIPLNMLKAYFNQLLEN